jgi:hypothetical protein
MSLREHTAYRLYQKEGDGYALHHGGRLSQQECVDQRAKSEQEMLRWVATHQAEIRADQYCGVRDALTNEDAEQTGEGVVFLSVQPRCDISTQRGLTSSTRSASASYCLHLTQADRVLTIRGTMTRRVSQVFAAVGALHSTSYDGEHAREVCS